jgi:multisubunit Na+/H+ antiporter MnhE subunit
VAVKQPGDLSLYELSPIGGGEPVAVKVSAEVSGDLTHVVLSVTTDLAPGAYQLRMPRESMFGGEDFAYFIVSR